MSHSMPTNPAARASSVSLSVVIPVRNEAENIAPLIDEIRAALSDADEYEIIYVDDGSTDQTYQTLRDYQRGFDRLRIVRHERNFGQSTAILSGVKAARYEWIATLDGDGQNDPADIPAMLATAARGSAQLVCGYRRKRRDTWMRRMSSRVANGVRSRMLRDHTPDTGCGLKVFRRDLFLALPYFDHMHRFLPALVQRTGGQVVSIDVNHRPRQRGQSNYGVHDRLWVGIVDMFGVMWLIRRAKRPVVVEGE